MDALKASKEQAIFGYTCDELAQDLVNYYPNIVDNLTEKEQLIKSVIKFRKIMYSNMIQDVIYNVIDMAMVRGYKNNYS